MLNVTIYNEYKHERQTRNVQRFIRRNSCVHGGLYPKRD